MIIREFVPNDLKRVCEIEKMSFDESYELNMFLSSCMILVQVF